MSHSLSSSPSSIVVGLTPEDGPMLLATAADEAAQRGARLVICSVVGDEDDREAVRAALAAQLADAALAIEPPTLTVRVGDRVDQLLDCAGGHDAELVILGAPTTEESVLARWFRPTCPTALVRAAPQSLLIVRESPVVGPVVAATDLCAPDRPVLRAAAEEAARRGEDVAALHCVQLLGTPLGASLDGPLVSEAALTNQAAATLRHALSTLALPADAARVEVGDPVEAAVAVAVELEATRLVVGAHRRSGWTRWLLGSVAERVLGRAPCSVLVVPVDESLAA